MSRRNRGTTTERTDSIATAVDDPNRLDHAVDYDDAHPDVAPSAGLPSKPPGVSTRYLQDNSYVGVIITLMRADEGPEAKLADASLEFVAGPLDGVVFTGFTVWHDRRRGVRISGPGRKWIKLDERGGEKNAFYPYVQSADPSVMGLPANVSRLISSAYYLAVGTPTRTVTN